MSASVILVILLGLTVAGGLVCIIERNGALAECHVLQGRIEALERWGEAAEQALVYAATVTDNPMVDKICMDHAIEWAALAHSPEEADGG